MAKRIREKLKILIEYTPNDAEDDWKLNVTVNDEFSQGLTTFGGSTPDLTLGMILKESKEIIEETLEGF